MTADMSTPGTLTQDVPGTPPAGVRRVLVVEDHEMMREAIERRLAAAGDFTVVASAETLAQARAALATYRPDFVLVDHQLPDGTGLDVLAAARDLDPHVVVVALSAHAEPALVAAYVSAGADGYATKTARADELLGVLRSAAAGMSALDTVATAQVLRHLRTGEQAAGPGLLSARETQVLALVADGLTNIEIAAALFVSPQTVKTYLDRIFTKIGIRDRAGAAAKAVRDGLLD